MMMRKNRWTIRVLVLSSETLNLDDEEVFSEEMVVFDQILATEKEIKKIINNAFAYKGRFSLTFPKGYSVQSFHTPAANLIHTTVHREGREKSNESKKILNEANRIIGS